MILVMTPLTFNLQNTPGEGPDEFLLWPGRPYCVKRDGQHHPVGHRGPNLRGLRFAARNSRGQSLGQAV